jgi:hypothetical protein
MAVDFGATLCDTESGWTATILARNAGVQLQTYVDGISEPLPVEVQGAVSKRFAHVPFRINITMRHLEKFDITYTDPNDASNIDPLTGETKIEEASFGAKLMRHFIIGGEILLSKNFHLRIAYNFQRRQELTIDTAPGIVGFSGGFGLKISKFILSYGRGNYHLAGGADHFSISANIGDFSKKKN